MPQWNFTPLVCAQCGTAFLVTPARATTARFCSIACKGLFQRRLPVVTERDIERFWSHVDSSDGPDACWPWTKCCDTGGYGRIMWVEMRPATASRLAYELTNGVTLAPNVDVCHTCDNPPCCNPAHLFAGTVMDNVRDMIRKGRNLIGERHQNARLTDEKVREIRRLCVPGDPQFGIAPLGRRFGVCERTIRVIVNGEGWRHVR